MNKDKYLSLLENFEEKFNSLYPDNEKHISIFTLCIYEIIEDMLLKKDSSIKTDVPFTNIMEMVSGLLNDNNIENEDFLIETLVYIEIKLFDIYHNAKLARNKVIRIINKIENTNQKKKKKKIKKK